MTLVLVLGLVALCTILVVAFLTLMSAELVSSKAASNETTATQLATTAVQLVQGTIIHATEPRTSAGVPDTGQAWACQPGMIRTYGTANPGSQTTASSSPLAYYKLYSSTNMIVSTPTSYKVDSDIVQAWDTAPSLFTDLNAPLNAGTANEVFPIADPRAADSDIAVQGFSFNNTTTMSGTTVNGVVNGTGVSTSDTTSRLPMPVRWLYVLQDGTLTAPAGTTAASWTSGTPTSTTGEYPTATNAIVGRVAFWTDDECGKVNINTASEGTYADTPVCNSTNFVAASSGLGGAFGATNSYCGDLQLSMYPGAAKEYQRYPGHPATTCLSVVLGNYLNYSSGAPLAHWPTAQAITDAIPRVSEYGTAGGSTLASSQAGSFSLVASGNATTNVAPDMDRLYSSVDEFAFKAPTSVTTSRTAQSFSQAPTVKTLPIAQTCRFFLTANSKAPELNLFGLPRVAMWPVWDDKYSSSRTILDNEILRCATVATNGGTGYVHPMIFSREDSTSPTVDWSSATLAGQSRNKQLYGYLQALTLRGVPGYGGNFATKYGTTDRDQILTEMFDYIRCTDLQDGSTGASSYTGIYGASGSNNAGQKGANGAPGDSPGQVFPIQITSPTVTQGFGRIAMVSELAIILMKTDDRKSLSSSTDHNNVATSVTVTGAGVPIPTGWTDTQTIPASYDPTAGSLIEWALVPKLDSVMCGWAGIANNIRIRFTNIQLNFQDQTGPSAAITITNPNGTAVPDSFANGILSNDRDGVIGGVMGAESLIDSGNATMSATPSMVPTGLFYSHQPSSTVTSPGGLMTVSGTATVQVYGRSSASASTLLQTINFNFASGSSAGPSGTLYYPVPNLFTNGNTWCGTYRAGFGQTALPYSVAGGVGTFPYPSIWTGAAGVTQANRNSGYRVGGNSYYWLGGGLSGGTNNYIPSASDIVRSEVPAGTFNGLNYQGDLRMLATTNSVPSGAFINSATKNGTSVAGQADFGANCLRLGLLFGAPGYNDGNLMATNSVVTSSYSCDIPSGTCPDGAGVNAGSVYTQINGVYMPNTGDIISPSTSTPGDWDNGPGLMLDGPFVNKPDEGVYSGTAGSSAGGGQPYIGYYQAVQGSGAQLPSLFAPNRIVSSPVMFGSLTVGQDHPWRTLLFRPAALPGYNPLKPGITSPTTTYTHPGGANPTIPDHLLLDLFTMPVVEPYGISEPLATAGKINLNYQIAPFTYITRNTGMQAVLKSVMITGLNPVQSGMSPPLQGSFVTQYKRSVDYGTSSNSNFANNNITRFAIDPLPTLAQFDSRFIATGTPSASNPNFFVSASDICDIPLIPAVPTALGVAALKGPYTATTVKNFWTQNCLTGDNMLERPYTYIYPRVTTQSNVFTVHVRAQSLKQVPADLNTGGTGKWVEGTDLVTGEYRGSFVIEKYLDPDNANITASDGSATLASDDSTLSRGQSVRGAKWRILSNKRFGQ